jgi:hypothetical protein
VLEEDINLFEKHPESIEHFGAKHQTLIHLENITFKGYVKYLTLKENDFSSKKLFC